MPSAVLHQVHRMAIEIHQTEKEFLLQLDRQLIQFRRTCLIWPESEKYRILDNTVLTEIIAQGYGQKRCDPPYIFSFWQVS